MSVLRTYRRAHGFSLEEFAARIGLKSKGHLNRLERDGQKASTDLAIRIDRVTHGAVPVRALRPDLSDVRVMQPSDSLDAPGAARDDRPPAAPADPAAGGQHPRQDLQP